MVVDMTDRINSMQHVQSKRMIMKVRQSFGSFWQSFNLILMDPYAFCKHSMYMRLHLTTRNPLATRSPLATHSTSATHNPLPARSTFATRNPLATRSPLATRRPLGGVGLGRF